MKYFSLVWAGLRRSRARTILTLLSAVVAFLLFGILNGVDAYLKQVVDRAHLDVLLTSNPALLPLPIAYLPRLETVPEVKSVAYLTLMNGYYRVPGNNVAVLVTDPTSLFGVNSDMQVSQADRNAIVQTRIGALITPALAQKYGWKRGDTISIHAASMPQKNGSPDWRFKIVGYLETANAPGSQILIANYSYIDLARTTNAGTVLQYLIRIKNPARAGAISDVIDDMFVNSPAQTKTMSQKDAAQSALARIGNIDFVLDAIIAAVFFTLLLLVGNALMQSFRERIREFALLKTLGFSDSKVAALVVAESLLLCVGASVIGLAAAWFALPIFGRATGAAILPHPPLIVVVSGLAAAILVGLICGAIPAWKARRLTIVRALAVH